VDNHHSTFDLFQPMTTPATRLITLIMLLQRRPNQQVGDLARELGVSVRTVHRYIDMLDEMGIPIYSERGPYGGFLLVRGYKMPPLVFTPEEAVAVHLGASLVGQMWGQLYEEAARSALAKLDNVLPDDQRQEIEWARRSLIATGFHRSAQEPFAPLLETLRQAIRDCRRVFLVYQGRYQQDPVKRELDPYALVHRSGWWYCVGFCHLRIEVRTFRADRFAELRLLEQSFEMPADFDVQAYLADDTTAQASISVRMRFFPAGAHLARHNRSYWDCMEEADDGSIEVKFSVPNLI
jgi:predicted DNA-binding transcriptional regulator YafY